MFERVSKQVEDNIIYHQAHSSHGGLGDTMDYDEAGPYLLISIYFFIYLFIQGRDLDSPMDIITQLIGSITASIGRFCAWECWGVRFSTLLFRRNW